MELLKNEVVDTLPLSRMFLRLDNYKLETIKEYYNINQQSHEALSDCYACAKLYLDYLDYITPKYDTITDEVYNCFIDCTGEPIPEITQKMIEKICRDNGGKCYKHQRSQLSLPLFQVLFTRTTIVLRIGIIKALK